MNHIYNLVWNCSKKCWTPAAEFTSSSKKQKTKNKKLNVTKFLSILAIHPLIYLLPTINSNAQTFTSTGYVSPTTSSNAPSFSAYILRIGSDGQDGELIVDNGTINVTKIAMVSGGTNNNSTLTLKNSSVINTQDISFTAGGNATTNIESGSSIIVRGGALFGFTSDNQYNGGVPAGAVGALTVTGANSSLEIAGTLISNWSDATKATINVANAGLIKASRIELDNSHLSIDGPTSKVIINNDLIVRGRNTNINWEAEINITNGGNLSSGSAIIGQSGVTTSHSSKIAISGNGSKWVNAGDLLVGDNANMTNTILIDNEGTLETGTLRMGNVAAGDNTLTVSQNGILQTSQITRINSNSNSFLIFDGGIVRATSNQTDFISNFGLTTLSAGGVTFDSNGFNIGVGTSFSGTGGIKKTGTGSLMLSGNSNYSGINYINEGLLIANTDTALGTGAIFIGGAGYSASVQVNKNINLSNSNTSYSNITIQDKGNLYGTGQVSTTIVNSGGKIQAGLTETDIATLTINGDLTLNAGSIYHAQLATNGSYDSDLLLVKGNVTLSGGNLFYSDIGENYEEGRYYTVIDASGSAGNTSNTITGSLNISGDSPFLRLDGKIGDSSNGTNNIYQIGLYRNTVKFSEYALTPNQKSTANALDQANTNGQLDNYVAGLSTSYVRNAFDLLSGEIHATLRSSLLGWSQSTSQSSLDQLRSSMGSALACKTNTKNISNNADQVPIACNAPETLTGWAQVIGNWNQTSSDGNAAKSKTNTGGLLLGSDYGLGNSGWRIGGIFGYGKSNVKSNARHSSADLQNYTFGIQTGKRFEWGATEHVNVMGGLSYTHHAIKTDRIIPRIDQTLKAKYNGNTVQAFGEVGYAMAPVGKWSLEPFASLNIAKQKVESFEETGGFAGVHSKAESKTYTTAMLGLHAQSNMEVSGKPVKLRGTLGFKQALGDKEITRTMAFNQGSPDYLIWGVPRSSSTMVLGIQAQMALSPNATFEAGFNGEFGKKMKEQAIQARVRWAF